MTITENGPAWAPSAAFADASHMSGFMRWLEQREGLHFSDYNALWEWSVKEPGAFWAAIFAWGNVESPTPYRTALERPDMPGAVWFPGATVNYAAHVFSHVRPDRCAIRHEAEDGTLTEFDWLTLERKTAAFAASLRKLGIGQGDRVVAYLPNTPETIIAFLATVSIGAIWSLCAPDMGAATVLERFRQIEPKAILTVSGYAFSGRAHDRSAEVSQLLAGLPTLSAWISMDAADGVDPGTLAREDWADLTAAQDVPLETTMVPFDHPLWVVYSSGTTGSPKAIVHGHGGVMLEHLKLLGLHCDVGAQDVFSWYSSTGWIMWNCQVGGLLTGATIALAEGSPGFPDAGRLWRFIERAGVTVFGAGAAWYTLCMKAGVVPREQADLSNLRMLGSTGSPLPPEAYQWIYDKARADIWIAPIAGGTDLAGVFLAGSPTLPVRIGEMQCRSLGAGVYAYDDAGNPIYDEVGELVCTTPMPSMPLYFWGDEDGSRLHGSYFDTYPGVWRQGDWVKITSEGGAIIYGRSDATINRHGIRMGTADIYRVVEDMDSVDDSLVVDLEYLGKPSCMILFLKMAEGATLTPDLEAAIIAALKSKVSPHHIPNRIEVAPDIPYTLTGKKLEVPIKRRLLGQTMAEVATPDAMSNPGCLDWYDRFADDFQAG
ncbi:acetoacetate--CoA ligase [Thalassovita aquimarina]|uniref:Acetoacetate--CoA ligase n=1 Tax=Thalassovita aquimarina TaxID=2785917 RepID=A0ABS5HUA7_9RHOB|nr:acetoacetate--CoA ligase [Thalassovita aquimarina]MBR9652570.1 acetoacetate--CoA ligase [Thalassovita aquimarina]